MEIKTRNVNTAFKTLVQLFHTGEYCGDVWPWEVHGRKAPIVRRQTRNGPVMMIDEPVTITYERPTERVLFNSSRDCNTAFHLYEALWMLAGRNDVAPLAYYNSKISNYSDDGETFNGAYGYRWRHSHNKPEASRVANEQNGIDQLDILVNHLKKDPTSRRAVLQMWNVQDDLLKIEERPNRSGNLYNPDLKHPPSKDCCCNLSVLFSIREEIQSLDMTVFNRSNDLIWGALGANVVHFSILQEYVAAHLGIEVGRYNQISNNLHVYESNWKPEEWLAYSDSDDEVEYVPACNVVPLVEDSATFDEQLPKVVSYFDGSGRDGRLTAAEITEPFLWDVVRPMMTAFSRHKRGKTEDALATCEEIEADDWRTAMTQWLERRKK